MLKIETSNSSPLMLIPELTPPAVYLDYCVIADLATEKHVLGQELRDFLLGKGGTLYLGWAHLVELSGLFVGPKYYKVRSYLGSFGRNFVLIDNNARAVIDKEANWRPGIQNPVIAEDFLRCLGCNWNGKSELDVNTLLDVMASDPSFFSTYKTRHRNHKDKIKQAFDDARSRYRTDSQSKSQLYNASYSYVQGTPSTDYIYKQMMRECVIINDQFDETDAIDFEHCVISLAYCNYVVLDTKWARRCGKIAIPPGAAKVFSTNQVDDVVRQIKSFPNPIS